MRYFLYPLNEPPLECQWDYDYFFGNRWIREAYEALTNHPARTTNPEEANYFIISETLACLPFNKRTHEIAKKINNANNDQFPYWNGGQRHLVFDLTDQPQPCFQNKELRVLKTAFHQSTYRPGFDISIPQFPRYQFDPKKDGAKSWSEREITSSFRGHPRQCSIRRAIFEQNNDKECVFKSCANEFEFEIKDNQMIVLESEDPHSYPNLLKNSRFSLLIRGTGYALSYRMIEAMNCGSVPVIISDGYILPFREILDYNLFSITIPENKVSEIDQLRHISETRWTEMHREVLKVFSENFGTTEKIINTTLNILTMYHQKETPLLVQATTPVPEVNATREILDLGSSSDLPTLKIALLSVCIGEEYQRKWQTCLDSKSDYCQKHGYTHLLIQETLDSTRTPHWTKVKGLQQHLAEYDYLFYSDCDAQIMNMNVKLEAIIRKYATEDSFLLITEDNLCLNSGNFLLKNCPQSHQYLADVWEQFPPQKLLFKEKGKYGIFNDQYGFYLMSIDPKYKEQILYLPQSVINAYACGCCGAKYQVGDFVIHFVNHRRETHNWCGDHKTTLDRFSHEQLKDLVFQKDRLLSTMQDQIVFMQLTRLEMAEKVNLLRAFIRKNH